MTAWDKSTLADLAFFQRGFDITKREQEAGDVPVVSSSGTNSFHSVAKVNGPGVVIGRKGTLGTVHYVEPDFWPHDTTLWVKDFKNNNPKFVYYFLKTMHLERFDVGGANPTLNRNHIHCLPILKPNGDIQTRIATILSVYDDLIENNLRRIALLEEAAQQLYKEWFVRLRFPGHDNTRIVDGLPEGWRRVTFGDCATLLSGGTPSKNMARYWDGDIPWVTAKDLKVNHILDSQDHVTQEGAENGTRLVPAGTILFVVRGMSLAKEFRVAMATRDVTFNQDLKALRIHEGVDPSFLFNFLLISKHHIMGICGEAAHGTKKLETDRILGVPLLLPPVDLQSKYASLAWAAQEMMIRLEQQAAKLAEARDLLLPRLMSGEIKV